MAAIYRSVKLHAIAEILCCRKKKVWMRSCCVIGHDTIWWVVTIHSLRLQGIRFVWNDGNRQIDNEMAKSRRLH